MVSFPHMCGLHGFLPTSGEHFMSIAPLEIYLLRQPLTCSILSLPALIASVIAAVGGTLKCGQKQKQQQLSKCSETACKHL